MPDSYEYMLDYLMQGEDARKRLEEQIRRMTTPPAGGVRRLSESVSEMQPRRGLGSVFGEAYDVVDDWFTGPDVDVSPDPLHAKAKESVDARVAEEARTTFERLSEEKETKRMQDEAMQRSLDPTVWVGGGGPDSGKEFPSDKLWKIRAEAKAKGRAGSLGAGVYPTEQDYTDTAMAGGGSFSQQAPSDALAARLAERDEWTAGQPERDLAYAVTPERARRDPEYAADAAGKLALLKEQRGKQQERDIQMAFVEKLAGSGGTIPRDQASQLQAIGVSVPYGAIGASKDDVISYFDKEIKDAGMFLASEKSTMLGGQHPMNQIQSFGQMRAQYYQRLVSEGQMNPDDARAAWEQEVAQISRAYGDINQLQGYGGTLGAVGE